MEKALSGSKNVRFEEFTALLEGLGYTLDRIRGSHHLFSHPQVPILFSCQPRKDGKAKPYQIQQLLKLIEQYDLSLDEDQA